MTKKKTKAMLEADKALIEAHETSARSKSCARYVCGMCGSEWTEAQMTKAGCLGLDKIHDLHERLDEGSTVPHGVCPDNDCGALVYLEGVIVAHAGMPKDDGSLACKVRKDSTHVAELLEAVLCSYDDKNEERGTINAGVIQTIKDFVKGNKRQLYIISYSHEYGTDTWLVRAKKEPTVNQVVHRFNLDFEEEKHEVIGIELVRGEIDCMETLAR